jgi:hypothetical protein
MTNHGSSWGSLNRPRALSLEDIPAPIAALGIIAGIITLMVAGGYLAEAILPTILS